MLGSHTPPCHRRMVITTVRGGAGAIHCYYTLHAVVFATTAPRSPPIVFSFRLTLEVQRVLKTVLGKFGVSGI